MHSRSKRKLKMVIGMFARRKFSALLFVLACCSTLTYLVVAQGQVNGLALPVLKWLGSLDGATEEKNVVSKEFNFVIKVLAYGRLHSLQRCLKSLAAADYGGDSVSLVILVDHFKLEPSATELEQPVNELSNSSWSTESDLADPIERNIVRARQMLRFLDGFRWRHGTKEVHYRSQNLGLQGQWIEAWWPASDNQFALIVEDDMELSPLYYRYVRSIIANYYYNPANENPSLFGISLQRPRFVAGKWGNSIQVDNSTRLFLYQMLGSWGQILFPKPWKEFRLWYDAQRARGKDPILGGMATSGWYRKLGDKIWTPWFVKFVYSRGYFNLHTNFLKERALSVSHRAKGVNYQQDSGPDSKLIRRGGVSDINLWEMPPLRSLKWYDFCFQQVFPGRLVNGSNHHLGEVLSALTMDRSVLIVSIIDVNVAVVRNWLCHLSSLGTKNYVLLATSDESDMASELARRGHAVMVVEKQDKQDDLLPEKDVYYLEAIEQVLKLDYDVWFVRPELAWLNVPLVQLDKMNFQVIAADTGISFHTGLVFLKSRYKVLRALTQSRSFSSLRDATIANGVLLGDLKQQARIIEESSTMADDDQSSKLVLLDETLSKQSKSFLEAAGLWLVDEELACKRVYCTAKA